MKNINLNCGVYQIRNIVTKFCYVGQSIHLKDRPSAHWSLLKNNKHDNIHLQRSYNKHGINNFVFEVLIYCKPEKLTRYEQFFVNKYVALNLSYNICRECVDSCKGVKRTEETCKKISEANKGEKCYMFGKNHSEETCKKISEALNGENNPMFGRRGKDSPNFGKHHTEKTRKKIGKSNKGKKRSEEIKNKLSETHKGQVPWNKGKVEVYSDETKERMSEAHKNQVPWNKGKVGIYSDETKEKMRKIKCIPKEIVLKIIDMLNKGYLQKGISKELNVCARVVRRAKQGWYDDIYDLKA